MRALAALGACVLLAGCSSNQEATAAASALMDADRAFAADADARGVHAAFTAALAEDAVIFRPEAVPGQKWLAANPEDSPPLAWEPDGAEVAGSIDLGVTTGTWALGSDDSGRYVTVWRREGERWVVVLDHGVSLPPEQAAPREVGTYAPDDDLPAAAFHASPAEIATVDLLFARGLESRGEMFIDLLDPNVEFLREGELLSGRDAAAAAYAPLEGADLAVRCQGAIIARDASIAATWGLASAGGQRFAYVRVWRSRPYDAQLRVRVDLLTPLPSAEASR
jgi:hypothetical protein